MRDKVQYGLGPLPWALAKPNGKTSSLPKSALINTLEKDVPLVHLLPENTVKIFDAIVLIQQRPTSLETFGDVSDFILAKIMHHHARISCLVSDQYNQWSIKDPERTDQGEVRYTTNRRNQSIPAQFRKNLHNSNNTLELIEFLIDDWVKDINITDILKDKELYVTVRDRAYRIFCRNGIPFKEIEQELCLSQEEADTKFFLARSFIISLGFESAGIVTNDTDILVFDLTIRRNLQANCALRCWETQSVSSILVRLS